VSTPIPIVNVELGIGDTIRAINEILGKPQNLLTKKQDETLVRLRQQLEIILKIVTELESLFIEILRGFRNDEILENKRTLKAHLNQTRTFLESRKLLPYLDTAIGAVEAAAFSPRFHESNYDEMVNGLRELRAKLHTFRGALGRNGHSGPGLPRLIQICALVEKQIATDEPVDINISKTAKEAFDSYDWHLSSDIHKLIGSITINS